MADKKTTKKKCLPGHVWMVSTKGAEMQLPQADAVGLTFGKKGFRFMYPEDDPRVQAKEKAEAKAAEETEETKETATNEK